VRDWYIKSFKDIRNFPPIRDRVDELKFAEFLQWIKTRHNDVVPTIAMGIREFKKELGLQQASVLNEVNPEIHQFLDRFFMSRIGIRMLIGKLSF
jgi:pyruvate dehydrogenase kinase 2/3/4